MDPSGGLIPAHAGKTDELHQRDDQARAHPRSRGENTASANGRSRPPGSSPLTRGKHGGDRRRRARSRLIPAHAGKTPPSLRGPRQRPAHPRSRGENQGPASTGYAPRGSSPLTRGKHRQSPGHSGPDRLIPAHAGKTGSRSLTNSPTEAHPRSRGENMRLRSSDPDGRGSSPLTRGKPRPILAPWIGVGLIPAHAGKTRPRRGQPMTLRAHPRSRGENPYAASTEQDPKGSSPLTRGKHAAPHSTREQIGLIPAHAGKTGRGFQRGPTSRAHPRSRGENSRGDEHSGCVGGSSPLTRGKRFGGLGGVSGVGLIPAHAGKTSRSSTRRACPRAHPRSRGENYVPWPITVPLMGSSPLTRGKPRPPVSNLRPIGLIPAHAGKTKDALAAVKGTAGSSPLTRGKPRSPDQPVQRCGLIPAHAGKTRSVAPKRWGLWAHPRSRGENRRWNLIQAFARGSSPLTRGKPAARWRTFRARGLIPAHAGKTVSSREHDLDAGAHPRSRGENTYDGDPTMTAHGSSPLTRGKPFDPD